ncbi:glycoside hydrolase family 11 protein, partial [uncultured Ruminococcus sp.]|uniref:glycoside hydrolase family 11 protein n=1 Tax=uncultured Ruminococcus sp. TaxID=165186 RepID=UPI0025EE4EAA
MKHSNLFGKAISAVTATAMLLMGSPAFPGNNTLTAKAADQQERGNIGGFDYEMWNQNYTGQVSMNPGAGNFTCSWSGIENFLARMGKNYDSKKQNYKSIGSNIVLTYDVEYTPKGNSYMCVYGWTRNPLMEYYIVEGWGDWRPPGDGAERKGNVTLNGNTYDICKTMRYNQPSLDGTATFPQYWSIRQTSGSRNNTTNYMSGTISVSKHFDAWSKAGLDMSGTLYEVSLNIEGYRSNGSANVKKITVDENAPDEDDPNSQKQDVEDVDPSTLLDENGYFFNDDFEKSSGSWGGRASETVDTSSAAAVSGSASLSVSGRNNTWNGAAKSLDSAAFRAGTEYSFSANVMYESGPSEQTFQLSLQYSDGSTTKYDHIASGSAVKGEWLQLANTKYTIPAGASDVVLYIETDDSDSDYIDFYVDDVIGAPAGTEIKGAEPPKKAVMGDVNFDGVIDSLDMITARKAILTGELKGSALKAADVDQNSKFETADLVLIQSYILKKITEWPEPEVIIPEKPDIDTSKWDSYKE